KVDGRSRNGATALLAASFAGQLDVVKLLLERGAALEQRNPQGGTALRAAADVGHIEVVRYLLGRGAKKNAVDAFGKLPVDYARENGHFEVAELVKPRFWFWGGGARRAVSVFRRSRGEDRSIAASRDSVGGE